METDRMPVLLVCGLAERPVSALVDQLTAPTTAVVHHDLAAVSEGVVTSRIRHAGRERSEALELAHGCVSCTLRENVLPMLMNLAGAPDVERVVLHLDPALEPETICWAIEHVVVADRTPSELVRIEAVLTVVDAATWLHDVTGTDTLADRGRAAAAGDERTVAQVVIGQVEFADAVVVHGAAPDADTARRTDAVLDRLAPLAARSPAAHLSIPALLAAIPPNARRGAGDDGFAPLLRGQPPLQPRAGIDTLIYHRRRPFHPGRLHDAVGALRDGVVRTRGRAWVATQPDRVLWLESAGGGLGVAHGGTWLAAEDDWSEVDPERRTMASLRWDVTYGDREQSLVVITHDAHTAEISAALDRALLTDDELAAGENTWRHWDDPFDDGHTDPCGPPREPADQMRNQEGRA